ncbi:MAG: WG repeat-containing protein [Pirellulaceae bacterium]
MRFLKKKALSSEAPFDPRLETSLQDGSMQAIITLTTGTMIQRFFNRPPSAVITSDRSIVCAWACVGLQFLLLASGGCGANTDMQTDANSSCLHIVRVKGKLGLINDAGDEQLPPEFAYIEKVSDDKRSPEFLIQEKVDGAWFLYHDGMRMPFGGSDVVFVDSLRDGVFAIERKDGTEILDTKRKLNGELLEKSHVSLFGNYSEGLIRFRRDGRIGFLNRNGKLVIEPQFVHASVYLEGLAAVAKAGGEMGYIDRTGKVVIPAQFDIAYTFRQGRAVVCKGTKWWYIDRNGNRLFGRTFAVARGFYEGRAVVKPENSEWFGYIDTEGNEVIPARYVEAGRFSEGLAYVDLGLEHGFIDPSGAIAFTLPSDTVAVYAFDCGAAKVDLRNVDGNSNMMYVNHSGSPIWSSKMEEANW